MRRASEYPRHSPEHTAIPYPAPIPAALSIEELDIAEKQLRITEEKFVKECAAKADTVRPRRLK